MAGHLAAVPRPETYPSAEAASSSTAPQPAEAHVKRGDDRTGRRLGSGCAWPPGRETAHRDGTYPAEPRRRPAPRAGSPRLASAPCWLQQISAVQIERNAVGTALSAKPAGSTDVHRCHRRRCRKRAGEGEGCACFCGLRVGSFGFSFSLQKTSCNFFPLYVLPLSPAKSSCRQARALQ